MWKVLVLLLPLLVQGAEIKLSSYNIAQDHGRYGGFQAWSERGPKIVEFVRREKFSIVGLQEARLNQFTELSEHWAEFKWIGQFSHGNWRGGLINAIFYNARIWEADLEELGTFWLSDTPAVKGSKTWGNRYARNCAWGKLTSKDGQAIYVYNTDFDHGDQSFREKACRLILEHVKARKDKTIPVVLMGDFDVSTTNPAIRLLLDSGRFMDPGKNFQRLTQNRWRPELRKGMRMSHILVSPGLPKTRFQILSEGNPPHSDHHPLTLTIELSKLSKLAKLAK